MTECPIVETSLGKVKGVDVGKVEGGKNVFLYTSLPFAKPPIGDLRFERPVSPAPWDGILDATKHSPLPIQDKRMMEGLLQYLPLFNDQNPVAYDEDCLYLSVYTSNPTSAAKLPVLFWIFGGGYTSGGELYYDARIIASLHDVVVVVPNYRVSIFGFLSLGKDTDYPGNMGLHDQIMALKWTQNHIEKFGGNREKVTIFGESAGSMAVGFHVVSPMSSGLFHRAISHSGTFYSDGSPLRSGDEPLKLLLDQLKITERDPQLLIKILKSMSSEKLLEMTNKMMETRVRFIPVFDGKFFPKPISILRNEPVVNNVPYIVGCNSTEGHGIMNMEFLKDYTSGISKEVCKQAFKKYVSKSFCIGLPESGYDAITNEYEKNKQHNDKMKWKKIFGEALADTIFVNPTLHAVKQHVGSSGKTYMYVMTQQLQLNHDSAYGPENARKPEFCECDHTDDVIFTFGLPLSEQKLAFDAKFTEDEKKLSKEWMKYIVNFAANGDPNVGLSVSVQWPRYNSDNREYLSVQQPCSIGRNFQDDIHKFWNEIVEPMRIVPE